MNSLEKSPLSKFLDYLMKTRKRFNGLATQRVKRAFGREQVWEIAPPNSPRYFERVMTYLPLELSEAVPLPWDPFANCTITERGTGMLYTLYGVCILVRKTRPPTRRKLTWGLSAEAPAISIGCTNTLTRWSRSLKINPSNLSSLKALNVYVPAGNVSPSTTNSKGRVTRIWPRISALAVALRRRRQLR